MVMEKMMQRLTMDKATKYSAKSLEKLRKRRQELVCTCTILYSTNTMHHGTMNNCTFQ